MLNAILISAIILFSTQSIKSHFRKLVEQA